MKVFMKIKSGYETFLSYYSSAGAMLIAVLMCVITFDVIARTFFNYSFQGTAEIVANSIVAIAFMQFAYCLAVGKHVRTTIIYDKANDKAKLCLDLFSYLIGFCIYVILIHPALDVFLAAVSSGEFEGEGALRIPTWPTKLAIFIGYVTLLIEYVIHILDTIFKIAGKNREVKV